MGLRAVEATVQVFGGIAITWEQLSHVRLRRVHLDRTCLGTEHSQYQRIAAARLAQPLGLALPRDLAQHHEVAEEVAVRVGDRRGSPREHALA